LINQRYTAFAASYRSVSASGCSKLQVEMYNVHFVKAGNIHTQFVNYTQVTIFAICCWS